MEYLRDARRKIMQLEQRILSKRNKVAQLRGDAMRISTADMARVKVSGGSLQRIEDRAEGYIDILADIAKLEKQWYELHNEVTQNIFACVDDLRFQDVLFQRYVMVQPTLRDVGNALGYSTHTIKIWHTRALREFNLNFEEDLHAEESI